MNSDRPIDIGGGKGDNNTRTRLNRGGALKIVLCILVGAVVVLVIGIALVYITKNGNNDGVGCTNKNVLDDIERCMNTFYDENGLDATVEEYGRVIDEAYDNGDERMFYSLLMDRSLLLSSNDKCIMAVDLLGDERVESLSPSNEKGVFYSRAIGASSSCGDDETAEFYRNKLTEVHENDNIEVEWF